MSAVDVDEILEHQLNANMLLMPYEVYAQLFDSVAELGDENAKLRELVEDMFYAVHPADREKFLINVAELGVEVDG